MSLTWFGSTRCRHQLQANSFARTSFEHRALPCAALFASKGCKTQLQTQQDQRSFQLTMQQLCFGMVQGGAQHTAFNKTALSTRSLKRSLPTSAWQTSASPTAFTKASTRATKRSLRRTLLFMVWFSFLINNIFFGDSFWRKEVVEHNELSEIVWEQELDKNFEHKPFQQDQHQQNLYREKNKNNKLDHNQLRENKVPDRELRQLHLQQLCLQDPASTTRSQLLKESLSSTCLSHSSLDPAASLSETLSFSKKKLSAQDLPDNSFDKFFPENFGQQISEKQLQQNLSTDQQQLQDRNLAQTTLQQLSLEKPNYKEKILNNELATNFDKKSLEENLPFQNFFFDNLAFQTPASGESVEKTFYKKQLVNSSFTQTGKEACKEQLLAASFLAASENKQLYSSLVQQSGAKAASHPELLPRELQEEQLADRPSTRTPLQRTACRGELLQQQLLQQQLSRRNLSQDSFSASSFPEQSFRTATSQTAALRTRLSDRQLQRQQLGRNNFQRSSVEKNTLQNTSFKEHSFDDNTLDKNNFEAYSLEENSFQQSSSTKSSFADSSLKGETFFDNSLEKETFSESSFQKSSLAAWKRAASTAALNRAAWSRTASKTPALQEAASEATAFKKTAWKQQPAWQTGAFRDQLCQQSLPSLSDQL